MHHLNILTIFYQIGNLRTPEQVLTFLEQRKQFNKDKNELNKKVKKESFEQREYSNLSYLYANNDMIEGEENVNK